MTRGVTLMGIAYPVLMVVQNLMFGPADRMAGRAPMTISAGEAREPRSCSFRLQVHDPLIRVHDQLTGGFRRGSAGAGGTIASRYTHLDGG